MGIRVTVRSSLSDMGNSYASKPAQLRAGIERVGENAAREGRDHAKRFAKESAGRHGKHYPKSITAERRGVTSWEYGPDSALPQGGMSFEFGSRNQPPHLDLAKSDDLMAPGLFRAADSMLDRIFGGR